MDSAAQGATLIDDLERQARWIEDGQSDGSPSLALAARLRALVAQLEGSRGT